MPDGDGWLIRSGRFSCKEIPFSNKMGGPQELNLTVYRGLVGKSKGKRLLERPRRRWEYNIKMDLQ
jgi:hypothetical protein